MKKTLAITLCLMLILAMVPGLSVHAEAGDLRTVTIMTPAYRFDHHPLSRAEEYVPYQIFAGWLAEKGVKLEFDLIAPEQYADTLKMRVAAQLDMPDMAPIGVMSDAEVLQMVNNGLLVNLLDACEQYDEDGSIWNYLDTEMTSVRGSTTAPDGGVYWFIYPSKMYLLYKDDGGTAVRYENSDDKGAGHGININSAFMEKIGMDWSMFMTTEEFKDMLVAFRENDVNENGAQDEILTVDISTFENGMGAAFGLFGLACFTDSDDTVHCAWYADGIKDYLTYMNELYELGVYDTKLLSDGMIDQTIASGSSSALYGYYGATHPWNLNPDLPIYTPVILDDDQGETGYNVQKTDSLMGIYSKFGIFSTCKDLEACIAVYDCIWQPDYPVLSQFGVEENYTIDENGIYTRLWTNEMVSDPEWLNSPLHQYLSLNALPHIYNFGNLNDPEISTEAAKVETFEMNHFRYSDPDKYATVLTTKPMAVMTEEEANTIGSLETVIATYSSELLTDMILGRKSVDDLDKYIEEMKGLGLDEYLAVFQARHDRYVASMGE